MNLVERVIRAVDGAQQRSRMGGFVFAVVKKFGDDRGPSLSAQLAYYGFMALFPLLLVLTTLLAFVVDPKVENNVIATTLGQFPVVGSQIGRDAVHPLRGSGVGLVVGLFGLVYGSLGLAQSAQFAMTQVWNVPGVVRPGFPARLARSLAFFAIAGMAMVLATGLSGLATVGGRGAVWRLVSFAAAVALNVGMYLAVFRVLTPAVIATGDLVPGAVLAGGAYSALLTVGTGLVQHQLRHAQAVYGQFAFVLGLMSWLYLVAQVSLYAAEMNVVRARRLWPRSIIQPPLLDADRQVLRDIVQAEERRPEQHVGVGFEPDATTEAAADAQSNPGQ